MARIRRMDDIEALERTPLAERGLPASTLGWLEAGAEKARPGSVALRFLMEGSDPERFVDFSHRELLCGVRSCANLLHELGHGPEDVTSLLLPNLPETYFSFFGAQAVGIVNPINPLLEPDAIADIMNAAGTRTLITLKRIPGADLWEKLQLVQDRVPTLQNVLLVDLTHYLRPLQRLLLWLYLRGRRRRPEVEGQRVLDFRSVVRKQEKRKLVFEREIAADDVAAYFHTGGATGSPKLAKHLHRNEVHDAWALGEVLDVTPETVVFGGRPLHHVNGITATGLTPFGNGATVVLGSPQGFRGDGVLEHFWDVVERHGITTYSGVPTVHRALLRVPWDENDLSSLQHASSGGAPFPAELHRNFEEEIGIPVLETYGLTEAACTSSINPLHGERRTGSIGLRLPYQDMKVVILDAEGRYQRDAEHDEVGSVILRGPNVFPGYVEPEHDAGKFLDIGDGGGSWLETGDLGRRDADGYFWLTGRRKELILRSGHNIDPAAIEQPLAEHPAVELVAAVPRPDPIVGEMPVAWVQLKRNAEGRLVEETGATDLLAHLRESMGDQAAVPQTLRIVEELPVTADGDVYKPELRRREVVYVIEILLASLPDVTGVQVDVGDDPLHGELVKVRLQVGPEADAEKLLGAGRSVLATLPLRSTLELAEAAG
ncbi:MAG: acyl-CoA synthetase [Acidobacteriota bacterium]